NPFDSTTVWGLRRKRCPRIWASDSPEVNHFRYLGRVRDQVIHLHLMYEAVQQSSMNWNGPCFVAGYFAAINCLKSSRDAGTLERSPTNGQPRATQSSFRKTESASPYIPA